MPRHIGQAQLIDRLLKAPLPLNQRPFEGAPVTHGAEERKLLRLGRAQFGELQRQFYDAGGVSGLQQQAWQLPLELGQAAQRRVGAQLQLVRPLIIIQQEQDQAAGFARVQLLQQRRQQAQARGQQRLAIR